MTITTLTSREFNQHASDAKRSANVSVHFRTSFPSIRHPDKTNSPDVRRMFYLEAA